jgi:streptogramin lyase
LPTDNSSPWGIAAGPDGALWFAQSGSNQIGRITTAGAITEYDVPTPSSFPYEITAGPDGALWFTENIGNKIGRITTAGGITEYDVPTANSDPWKIVAGPDGALWFTEYGGGKIGRITTAGAITEYPLPNAQSVPTGITAARDKALWFTEYVSPSKIARITTAGLITEYPVPEVTEAWRIAAGPDGALWFTGNFSAEIGRAPDCGLGFSASFANSTLTMNFNLGIDTPATFNILLHSKTGAREPYSKAISAVAPPQAFTLTWSAFPDLGDTIVEPTLAAQPGGSGLGLCSEWTTVNTAR